MLFTCGLYYLGSAGVPFVMHPTQISSHSSHWSVGDRFGTLGSVRMEKLGKLAHIIPGRSEARMVPEQYAR